MELQTNKGRRIIPLHPRESLGATFALKYVSQLVPALQKIQENASEEEKEEHEIKKCVLFQVDTALASSAEGFAWSRALKNKLFRENYYVYDDQELGSSSISHLGSFDFSVTAHDELESECNDSFKKSKSLERVRNQGIRSKNRVEIESAMEDEEVCQRLSSLRNLLPGGNEMDTEELLMEIGTYLVCLQQQVHILSCLVDVE